MPELWLRFDRDDSAIMGENYVDVIPLTVPPFLTVLEDAGLPGFEDLIGMTPEENAYMNEATPPAYRKDWTPDMSPWTDPDTGLAMSAALREAMRAQPDRFADWPDMIAHTIELLDEFDLVLRRAKEKGAAFQCVQGY